MAARDASQAGYRAEASTVASPVDEETPPAPMMTVPPRRLSVALPLMPAFTRRRSVAPPRQPILGSETANTIATRAFLPEVMNCLRSSP